MPKISLGSTDGKKFSKGLFTLVDLGPPSHWQSRSCFKDRNGYIKVRDSNRVEGWIHVQDFDSHSRGGWLSRPVVTKRWMSLEGLEAGRRKKKERLRLERQKKAASRALPDSEDETDSGIDSDDPDDYFNGIFKSSHTSDRPSKDVQENERDLGIGKFVLTDDR